MIAELPAAVAAWTGRLPPPDVVPWTCLLRRMNTETQVLEHYGYVRHRQAAGYDIANMRRGARAAVRLTTILGNRPFIDTTVADVDRFIAVPQWGRAVRGQAAFSETAFDPVTKNLLKMDVRELRQLFAFLYEENGMAPAEAKEKARLLFDRPLPKFARTGNPVPENLLTAEQVKALQCAVVTLRTDEVSRSILALMLALLMGFGTRGAGALRMTMGRLAWGNGLATLEVPAGFQRKGMIPLFLGPRETALLQAYLKHHPTPKDPKAPLFVCPASLAAGNVQALSPYEFHKMLLRLGNEASLGFRLGTRAFRKWRTTQDVMNGATDEELRRRLGHSKSSQSCRRYTILNRMEVAMCCRALRGAGGPVRFSRCCRFRMAPGDAACGHCGRPTAVTVPFANNPAMSRLEMAGALGLEAIGDAGAA